MISWLSNQVRKSQLVKSQYLFTISAKSSLAPIVRGSVAMDQKGSWLISLFYFPLLLRATPRSHPGKSTCRISPPWASLGLPSSQLSTGHQAYWLLISSPGLSKPVPPRHPQSFFRLQANPVWEQFSGLHTKPG